MTGYELPSLSKTAHKFKIPIEWSEPARDWALILLLDGKHAALLPVSASEDEIEKFEQRLHKSSARCRRSQLPLVSSQANKARTLLRARAIEQSAAP